MPGSDADFQMAAAAEEIAVPLANVKRELFPAEDLPPELEGLQPAKRRKAAKVAASEAEGAKLCKVCGEPAVPKSVYCGREKRSYESLYRHVTKNRPKKDKAAAKKWEEEDKQFQAFNKIFGFNGDPAVQAKVLLDFNAQCPESNVKGKARGTIDLTRYVQSEGVRDELSKIKGRPLMDWELFQHKMGAKRGWTAAKAGFATPQFRPLLCPYLPCFPANS